MSVTLERPTTMTLHLQQEQAAFARLLPSLAKDEGKFAVIFGDDLIGVYESYSDALTAGYEKAGPDKFLVKRISTISSVSYFSRQIDMPCHT